MVGGIKLISDKLTNLTTNGAAVDIVSNTNSIFGDWFIFAILLSVMIVLALSLYSWGRDFLASFNQSAFLVSVMAFMFSLIRDSNDNQLLGFDKVMIFIMLLALTYVAKKIGE